jgi:DNA gyrase subunit A
VATINKHIIDEIGEIASARVVQEDDDLTIMSANGVIMRTKVKNLTRAGRSTRGSRIMDVKGDDTVATMARFSQADLRSVGQRKNNSDRIDRPQAEISPDNNNWFIL